MSTGVSYDHTAAAAIYSTSNQFSWAQALLVPGVQAAANILLLNKQKDHYDSISATQRSLIDVAVTNYFNCIESLLPSFADAYPDVPQAAEYVPVDPCAEQGALIECNIGHIKRSADWADCINRYHEQSDITRAVVLDPRWLASADLYSVSMLDLLRGKLPVGDVVDVLTDSAEAACLTGRVGGCRSLVARDLGLSRLRAQAAGREELRRQAAWMESISPVRRHADIRELMQTPEQRIGLALTQAQLIQNSLQNLYNRNAQKPPHRMAELQMRLERCINRLQHEAAKGSLVNTFVPNYAAILQPQIQAVASELGKAFSPASSPMSSYSTPSMSGRGQMGVDPYSFK